MGGDEAKATGGEGAQKLVKPNAIHGVPGLFQFPDFITEQEEDQLLKSLDSGNKSPSVVLKCWSSWHSRWQPSSFNGECMTQRWGVVTDLKRRSVRPCSPLRGEEDLPGFLRDIVGRWVNRWGRRELSSAD
eukprot:753154-Hanusia_phi.AAC.3